MIAAVSAFVAPLLALPSSIWFSDRPGWTDHLDPRTRQRRVAEYLNSITGHHQAGAPYTTPVDTSRPATRQIHGHQEHQAGTAFALASIFPAQNMETAGAPIVPVQKTTCWPARP